MWDSVCKPREAGGDNDKIPTWPNTNTGGVGGGGVIVTSLESQTIPPLSSLQASRVSNDAQIASARLEFLSVEINAANV